MQPLALLSSALGASTSAAGGAEAILAAALGPAAPEGAAGAFADLLTQIQGPAPTIKTGALLASPALSSPSTSTGIPLAATSATVGAILADATDLKAAALNTAPAPAVAGLLADNTAVSASAAVQSAPDLALSDALQGASDQMASEAPIVAVAVAAPLTIVSSSPAGPKPSIPKGGAASSQARTATEATTAREPAGQVAEAAMSQLPTLSAPTASVGQDIATAAEDTPLAAKPAAKKGDEDVTSAAMPMAAPMSGPTITPLPFVASAVAPTAPATAPATDAVATVSATATGMTSASSATIAALPASPPPSVAEDAGLVEGAPPIATAFLADQPAAALMSSPQLALANPPKLAAQSSALTSTSLAPTSLAQPSLGQPAPTITAKDQPAQPQVAQAQASPAQPVLAQTAQTQTAQTQTAQTPTAQAPTAQAPTVQAPTVQAQTVQAQTVQAQAVQVQAVQVQAVQVQAATASTVASAQALSEPIPAQPPIATAAPKLAVKSPVAAANVSPRGAGATSITARGGAIAQAAPSATASLASQSGTPDRETDDASTAATPATKDPQASPVSALADPTTAFAPTLQATTSTQAPADAAASPTATSSTIANLSAQIVDQSGQKTSRFDVQLTPDGLGRVDVAVEIDSKGQVTAALSFERPETAALIKDKTGDLQAALASAGLNLAPEALRISHMQSDSAFAATGSNSDAGSVTLASQASPDNSSGQGGQQGGQSQNNPFQTAQHFSTGGQSFQQGQQQAQQQRGQSAPAFGNARSFEAAASAADVTDRQSAYAGGLATRGLDIRI